MVEKVVFWGATGQARVLRECLEAGLRLVALFDNDRSVPPPFPDVPIHYGEDGFTGWLSNQERGQKFGCLVAVGGEKGAERLAIQDRLVSHGLVPIVARHASAFVAASAKLGEGSQVLAMAAVSVEARLGRACIVNTGATVDHECRLGDGVHIGPGAHLGGLVEVGPCAMVGIGASVLPRVRVGTGAVVGAGAVVVRDVEPYAVVVGSPARKVGERPQRFDG